MSTPSDFRAKHLDDIRRTYRNYKLLGDRAMAQVTDADLHTLLDADANSIAIIVKHLGGNLKSRFADFLTSDGEKPTRNRDDEFEIGGPATRAQIQEWWEDGWATVFGALDALTADDLEKTVYIRKEPFLVVEALNRSVTHAAYHVGQIVFLAKHFAGSKWTSLSIPKNKSGEHVQGQFKSSFIPTPSK
jgi:hypothetical protein